MIERNNLNSLKQCRLIFDVTKHKMKWDSAGGMLGGRKSDTAFYSHIAVPYLGCFHTMFHAKLN